MTICADCGSTQTSIINGKERWYKQAEDPTKVICKRCNGVRAGRKGKGIKHGPLAPEHVEKIRQANMGRNKLTEIRNCSRCGSSETYRQLGRNPKWHKDGANNWICQSCYLAEYRHDTEHQEKQNAYLREYSKKSIRFKDKRPHVGRELRIGICSMCGRSKATGELKKTHMHHDRYDSNDPTANTRELCESCHMKETIRLAKEAGTYVPPKGRKKSLLPKAPRKSRAGKGKGRQAIVLTQEIEDRLKLGEKPMDLVRMGYHSAGVYKAARKLGISIRHYK